jgi:DNA-binding IclR family transcriptional regulator
MQKEYVDKLLNALTDGKWHTVEEIADKTRIQEQKVKIIASFVKEFKFIKEDKKTGRIRLTRTTMTFLEKLGKTDQNSSYEEITA